MTDSKFPRRTQHAKDVRLWQQGYDMGWFDASQHSHLQPDQLVKYNAHWQAGYEDGVLDYIENYTTVPKGWI